MDNKLLPIPGILKGETVREWIDWGGDFMDATIYFEVRKFYQH